MAVFTDARYRIKRSASQEEQMRYLFQDLKIFQSYSQILMVSAIIGYNNNAYAEIERAASDPVQITFFSEKDKDYMDFLAYARTKDQAILSTSEKYEIFESYANGGFPILVDKLGINFDEPEKNDRLQILKEYYKLLLIEGFKA